MGIEFQSLIRINGNNCYLATANEPNVRPMKRLHPILSIAFFYLLFHQPIIGKVIYVDANVQAGTQAGTSWADAYPNLSFGIFFAQYGDTLWVAQGSYFPTGGASRTLSFTLKNGVRLFGGFNGTETMVGERDWEVNETILSGDIGIPNDSTDNSYNVVYCSFADSTTILDGFIITGGNADDDSNGSPYIRQKSGGGMYIVGSLPSEDTRPVITNCKFKANHAAFYGGGIFIRTDAGAGANPIITNCTFQNNSAFNGGGIRFHGGSNHNDFIIDDCIFKNNDVVESGGGISFAVSTGNKKIEIAGCRFEDNFAVASGGGVYYELQINNQEFKIKECDFIYNELGSDGSGSAIEYFLFAKSEKIVAEECFFYKNKSGSGVIGFYGIIGASLIHVKNSIFDANEFECFTIAASVYFTNCLIKNSRIGDLSGADDLHAEFNNCTFINNLIENGLTALGISSTCSNSDLVLNNCVSYGNFIPNKYLFSNGSYTSWINISNSLLGYPNCSSLIYNVGAYNNLNCGLGNIFGLDPMFADPTTGDFTLLSNSPAINAGDNAIVDSLGIATDLTGGPRIIGCTVDMGAYEAPSTSNAILYVNTNVQGGNQDGTSWDHAFSDLQDALAVAKCGDNVWVAKGTYFPTTTTDRTISFELPNGVAMYGGFVGTESTLDERDWQTNETILSGDIGVVGDSLDNSHTVVYMEYVDSTTVLDGLSIVKGRTINVLGQAPILDRKKSGGGIYVQAMGAVNEVNPKILNCSFLGNYAFNAGGGVFVNGSENGNVSPYFDNCIFLKNRSSYGGGISIIGGSFTADWRILNSLFFDNDSGYGVGVSFDLKHGNNDIYIENCNFIEGNSGAAGSGINVNELNGDEYKVLHLIKCTFENNDGASVIEYVGFSDKGEIHVDSCIFKNNDNSVGLLSVLFGRPLVEINNSVFSENENDVGCLLLTGGYLITYNSIFNNNSGTLITLFGSGYPIDALISNCTFYENRKLSGQLYEGLISADGFGLGGTLNIANSIFRANFLNSDLDLFSLVDCEATISHSLFDLSNCSYISDDLVDCDLGILFSADPLFQNPNNNDFTLLPCSPAINAGDNAIVNSLGLSTDLAGNPRVLGGTVDMGAFETPTFSLDSAVVALPSCGGVGGAVQFQLSHGCEPYSYAWSDGTNNGADTSGLAAGDYSFTVTDALGQSVEAQLTILEKPAVTATSIIQQYDCTNIVGGMVNIMPTGGTAPFAYNWSNGSSDNLLTGLPPETYVVTVTDANGCTYTDSLVVGSTGHLLLSLSATPYHCQGSNDGVAEIIPLNGTSPFMWHWQGGQTDSLVTGLGSGNYSITVTDALGCTDELQFSMVASDSLMASANGTDVLCFGQSNGMATIGTNGGSGTFGYLWSNGMDTPTIDQLSPGWYGVTITDELYGCSDASSVNIVSPQEVGLFVEATDTICFGAENGIATAVATGGTLPFSFIWNNGQTDSLLMGLPSGNYAVTVADANGCQETALAEISISTEIQILFDTIHASGSANADGGVKVIMVFGGQPDYNFLWSNGDTSQSLENVLPGDYSLIITDADSCQNEFNFTVDLLDAIVEEQGLPLRAVIVPNPSGYDGAQLWVDVLFQQPLTVHVIDPIGRILFAKEIIPVNGQSRLILPQELAPGMYWVVLENGNGGVLVLKWVVV